MCLGHPTTPPGVASGHFICFLYVSYIYVICFSGSRFLNALETPHPRKPARPLPRVFQAPLSGASDHRRGALLRLSLGGLKVLDRVLRRRLRRVSFRRVGGWDTGHWRLWHRHTDVVDDLFYWAMWQMWRAGLWHVQRLRVGRIRHVDRRV